MNLFKSKWPQLFIILLLSCLSHSIHGKILFTGNFESGKIYPLTGATKDSFFYGAMGPNCQPSNKDYSNKNDNSVVTNIKRAGAYANKLIVRRNCDYRSYNDGILQRPRQETGVTEESYTYMGRSSGKPGLANQKVYWMGTSIYLPSDGFKDDYAANPTNIFQLKKFDNNSCCFFNVTAIEGKLVFAMPYLYSKAGVRMYKNKDFDPKLTTYTWDAKKDVWHDIVVKFKACTLTQVKSGCVPFFELYINVDAQGLSTPVWKSSGLANTNSTDGLNGPKLNIYKYAYNCKENDPNYDGRYKTAQHDFEYCNGNPYPNPSKNLSTITAYYDELFVGDSNSSLTEVAPHWKKAAPKSINPPELTVVPEPSSTDTNGALATLSAQKVSENAKDYYKVELKGLKNGALAEVKGTIKLSKELTTGIEKYSFESDFDFVTLSSDKKIITFGLKIANTGIDSFKFIIPSASSVAVSLTHELGFSKNISNIVANSPVLEGTYVTESGQRFYVLTAKGNGASTEIKYTGNVKCSVDMGTITRISLESNDVGWYKTSKRDMVFTLNVKGSDTDTLKIKIPTGATVSLIKN